MIRVDIATKIIDPKTSIWVVWPGRGRAFINDFIRQSVVFLETPGLKLPPNAANDVPTIRQHVRMSLAISAYVRGASTRVPSRSARSYPDGVFNDRSHQVLAANVRKMFGRMKTGDLVIVPGRMFALSYFGEVEREYALGDVTTVARYGNEDMLFRKLRWLNAGVPRNSIPQKLQPLLSKPPAIAQVQRSIDTDEFFKFAYPAFVLADKSAIILDGPKYDGKNPLATLEANLLVTYFIAAFAAIEQDKLEEFASLDVTTAARKFFDPDLVQSFSQNSSSPVIYGLNAKSAILGAFVSVGVALSLYQLSPATLKGDLDVTNSVSPRDSIIAKDAGVKLTYLFNSLHKEQIDEIEKLGKKAKDNIDLTTPVEVEVDPQAK